MEERNKTFYNLSLLELYFKKKYDILISIREYEYDLEAKNMQGKETAKKSPSSLDKKFITVKLKTGEMDLGITREVEVINDVFDTELLTWFKNIEEIMNRNQWSEETKKLFLYDFIEDNIIDKNQLSNDYKANKEYILSRVFTSRRAEQLITEAERIKQVNHIFIDTYVKEIKERLDIYTVTAKCSRAEYERRLKELIHRGLAVETRSFLDTLGLEDVNEIIKELKRIEEVVVTRFRIPRKIDSVIGRMFFKKWCKIHKKLGHATKDCALHNPNHVAKQQNTGFKIPGAKNQEFKKLNERKENKDFSNYLVLDSIENFDDLKLPVLINSEHYTEAILDDGTGINLISEEFTSKHYLQPKENKPRRIIFGNKETEDVTRTVTVKVNLKNTKEWSKVEFYVYSKLPVNMILGRDFLMRNGIIINYTRKIIQWNDEIIQMKRLEEEDFIQTSVPKTVNIHKELNLEELIEDYKRKTNNNEPMNVEPVEIKIIEKKIKVTKRNYVVPNSIKEAGIDELERLIEDQTIEECNDKMTSPAFFREKKNGQQRVIIDLRDVNEGVEDEIAVIPPMDDIIYNLGQCEFISKIDLTNGFNQLKLSEESRKWTAFTMFGRTFRYIRLPFGLKCGPKIFQNTMNKVLFGIKNVAVYIDDIIIATKTKEEHQETLMKVFERLGKYNVKINFSKSEFFTTDTTILGTRIVNGKLYPEMGKN